LEAALMPGGRPGFCETAAACTLCKKQTPKKKITPRIPRISQILKSVKSVESVAF